MLFGAKDLNLEKLDCGTRRSFLKYYVNEYNLFPLSDKLIQYVVEKKLYDTPRKIIGLISNLPENRATTIRDIDKIDEIKGKKMPYSFEQICEAVASFYGVTTNDIRSKSRSAKIAQARKVFYYFATEKTATPIVDIGLFCNRKHSSVIYHLKIIKKDLQKPNSLIAQKIAKINL